MTRYLAIDVGASSGRHVLGSYEDGRIELEEIYRFENGMRESGDGLVWDTETLFSEILRGIARCGELGKIPATVAIDTWGVDYVLLDGNGKELFPVYAYRNARLDSLTDFPIPFEELYARTGIQRLPFNTVYQLFLDVKSGKAGRARHFLMIPDYLAYRLTGVMKNEYTVATTTAMVNAKTGDWDGGILEKTGLDRSLFLPLSLPGESVGAFAPEIAARVGFDAEVVCAPSHDTASAVAACPLDGRTAFLSSGTWSLFGVESAVPVTGEEARKANFSNEGGAERRFRFLKNIMGMWLFQSVRRDTGNRYSYDGMMRMAMESGYTGIIDVNHPSLSAPGNMIEAVRRLAGEKELSLADTLSCLYHSLAAMYAECAETVGRLTGKTPERILITGGGSRDRYLNALTARYTGKKVLVGLGEATAAGNVAAQIMKDKNLSLDEVRERIRSSFDIREAEDVFLRKRDL